MIKFFRKIRQDLLSKGKTGKYFKYAIGEIILVVIGILIALQINNWNEKNKQSSYIQQAFLEVQNNLVNDSLQMTRVMARLNSELKIQQEIINAIENGQILDSSYNQSLSKCMTMNLIQVTENGYKNLQTLGLKNIKNKNLENLLIKYYDILNKDMIREVSDDNVDLLNVWLPYVRKNFKDFDYRKYAVPKSYEKLSADSEFLVMLKINIDNREATLEELTKMQVTMRNLLESISNKK